MNAVYRFAGFELQPGQRRLLAQGRPVALGPRPFELLVALVERAGELVSKDRLLDLAWPGLVVEENNLQVQVSALRKVLGAGAIATVPGRGYRFALEVESAGLAPTAATALSVAAEVPLRSIAVLPFVNIGGDVANEYFADGLAEELLNVLSKIRGLRVASRTSAFSFKGAGVDIATVARKLNVATILEGSVRTAGSRVRVTAQLVHVATDSHLWSESYDREIDDIFALQDDIAQCVVRQMRAALMGEQEDGPDDMRLAAEVLAAVRGRSRNTQAYRLYLLGSFFRNRLGDHDMRKAIAHLREALALDPHYGLAWALLSDCYLVQGAIAWQPFAQSAERAREAARRALDEGAELAASHWAMGAVHLYYDWDWKRAEASIRRALQLAPHDAQLNAHAARLMQNLGRMDEAEALLQRALALDPLSVEAHMAFGSQLGTSGQLAQAQAMLQKAFELNPQRAQIHASLGAVALAQGRLDEALREVEQESHEIYRLHGVALVQHARGQAALSAAALRELVQKHADAGAYQIAVVHAFQGDADSAFRWLQRAYRQRDAGLPSLKLDSQLKNLHADPRWRALLRKMGMAN